MKLEHIALSISDPEEINNFYVDILGMIETKTFVLSRALAKSIFDIEEEVSVFLLEKNGLLLEIFLAPGQKKHHFNHICLTVNDRETLFNKAAQNAYECIRIEREAFDLIFIKDKIGNIFEIKEKE